MIFSRIKSTYQILCSLNNIKVNKLTHFAEMPAVGEWFAEVSGFSPN